MTNLVEFLVIPPCGSCIPLDVLIYLNIDQSVIHFVQHAESLSLFGTHGIVA